MPELESRTTEIIFLGLAALAAAAISGLQLLAGAAREIGEELGRVTY